MRLSLPSLPEPARPVDRRRDEDLARSHEIARRYVAQAASPYATRHVDVILRLLDITLAATILLAFAPFIAAAVVAVLLTSGRPVLYRGLRVGRAGELFTIYKLRTLRPGAEDRLGPFQDKELDRRTESETTRVGRVLRATQLDELPQLYNVLRGEMSIVGPRPIRPVFFEELVTDIPQYWQRLVVRPGLTGFAQLRVERDTTWAEKLAHDLEYLADRSVRLYLRVVVETARRILRRSAGEVAGLTRGGGA
ncbi:MAG TPA: sugar transferase [Baekduia sp.]|nr:sugar transferase [Baekduia sp.]